MANKLCDIYEQIFDQKFEFSSLDKRIQLQKAVYILENLGLNIGDYSFTWNTRGPYSIALDYDAMKECENLEPGMEYAYSDFAKRCFEQLKKFIKENMNYSLTYWIECIASLHYLLFVEGYSDKNVLDELLNRKDYLNQKDDNEKALQIAECIVQGGIDGEKS